MSSYSNQNRNYNGRPPRRRRKKRSFFSRMARKWKRGENRKEIAILAAVVLAIIIAIILVIVLVFAKGSDDSKETKAIDPSASVTTTEATATTKASEKTTQVETTTEYVIQHHDVVYQRDEIEVYDDEVTGSSDTNWHICVNLSYNTVIIYKVYEDGSEEPVKAMVCSVGREGLETCDGEFYLGEPIFGWCYMADGTYGQYSFRIIDGTWNTLMFHAVPYYAMDRGTLVYDEFNTLGTAASMGCVRLMMKDAIWLISHVGQYTPVSIYYADEYNEPLPTPETYFIPPKVSEINGWDPTDPLSYNPWHSYSYTYDIPDSITVPRDATVEDIKNTVIANVTATDIYGYDVAEYSSYQGTVDTTVPGYYPVSTYLKLGPITAQKTVTVIVQ